MDTLRFAALLVVASGLLGCAPVDPIASFGELEELEAELAQLESARERVELRERVLDELASAARSDLDAHEAYYALRRHFDMDPGARADADAFVAERVAEGLVFEPTPGDMALAEANAELFRRDVDTDGAQ